MGSTPPKVKSVHLIANDPKLYDGYLFGDAKILKIEKL